jgi:proteic killer suppression protein
MTYEKLSKFCRVLRFKSLNYERLKGDKKDLESVRVNDKYRIEFRSRIEGTEPDEVVTICSIEELTNHYQ